MHIARMSLYGCSMDPPELTNHSFIVKIWHEEADEGAAGIPWRGHVTHVPGGERHYFEDLREIAAFIRPFLDTMGVTMSGRHSLGARLARWRIRLTRRVRASRGDRR
jgi:hypothetical protein